MASTKYSVMNRLCNYATCAAAIEALNNDTFCIKPDKWHIFFFITGSRKVAIISFKPQPSQTTTATTMDWNTLAWMYCDQALRQICNYFVIVLFLHRLFGLVLKLRFLILFCDFAHMNKCKFRISSLL